MTGSLDRGRHGIDVASVLRTDQAFDADVFTTPRSTPLEWARRRRVEKEAPAVDAARDRTKDRLHRLGEQWHLIDADDLGLGIARRVPRDRTGRHLRGHRQVAGPQPGAALR